MENKLRVRKIRNGTVIDHIPAGLALDVLKILNITGKEGVVVAVVMNVDSKKLGKKDIVKIEDVYLDEKTVNKIALIAPSATINIVKEYNVVSKRRVEIPLKVRGILKCINPNCITNQPREPIESSFTVISRKPIVIKCDYCGAIISYQEIFQQLVSE